MDEREHLKELLKRYKENLHKLELQAAQHGGYDFSPLPLQIQIDRQREEIERLQAQLLEEPEAKELEEPGRRIPSRILERVLIGLFITVVGGVIVAWIIWEGELFAPKATPTVTSTPAPTSMPTVAAKHIELALWFEVKTSDAGEFVRGSEKGEYKSGDIFRFHLRPTADGYAYLFNIDTQGKFTPFWPDYTSRDAARIKAGEYYQTWEFRLDQSEGWEQVFAVASLEPFSYDEDIAPYLKPLETPKGLDPVRKRLELREGRFFHKQITFAHLK